VGNGSLTDHTFSPKQHEVLHIMPNGQLHFALYDAQGNLMDADDTTYTYAGKPAKCLWCHEINLLRPFYAVTAVPGYQTPQQFTSLIQADMNVLHLYRGMLGSEIDYTRTQDHTFAELLYISFMEPTAERLALDWNMSPDQVKAKLAGLPVHANTEFSYSTELYTRSDVEALAPYQSVRVSDSAREKSAYEPDLIH
jgi:hypothetical protein